MNRSTLKKGYSLTELAIVVVAIGILAVMATGVLLPMTMKNKADRLLNELTAANDAVEAFVRLNLRLPTAVEFDNITGLFREQMNLHYKINPNIREFTVAEYYLSYKPDDNATSPHNMDDNTSDVVALLAREAEAVFGTKVAYAYYIDATYKNENDNKYRLRHVERYYTFIDLFGRQPLNSLQFLTNSVRNAKRGFPFRTVVTWRGGNVKTNASGENTRNFDIAVGLLGPGPAYCEGDGFTRRLCYRARPRARGIDAYHTFPALVQAFQGSPVDSPVYFNMVNSADRTVISSSFTSNVNGETSGTIDPNALPTTWEELECQLGEKGFEPTCEFWIDTGTRAIPRYGRFDTDPSNVANNPANRLRYVGEYFDLVIFLRDKNSIDPGKVYKQQIRVNLYPLR